jgi:hypothetical protein
VRNRAIEGSWLDAVSDLSPTLERSFDSYSPSLVGKGLGVKSVLSSTAKCYIEKLALLNEGIN